MLSTKFINHNIILASGSPRRQQFLKDLHLDFEVKLKPINENYPLHLKDYEITDYLSELKANAFKTTLKPNDILITSDTIVWSDGKALGKPKDITQAKQMLQGLSDKSHKVISSVTITTTKEQLTLNDTTMVHFKRLTDTEIDYYITNYKPFDKAGSYGIQEWIGKIAINEIQGSYFTVMGLPTHKLYDALMHLDL